MSTEETVVTCVLKFDIFYKRIIWKCKRFILFYFNFIYLQVSNNEVDLPEMDGELYNWVKEERKYLFMNCFHKKPAEI